MIKNLLNKILLLGIIVFGYFPLQTFAQTTITYTADSTMSDAMVGNGGVQNSNYGSQDQIKVYHQLNRQIAIAFRSYIQYDLSAVPADAIITEAKLKLTAHSVVNAINHPIYIERVGSSVWYEDTITWNNQPSVVTSDQLSFTHAETSTVGLQEFLVTDHVQKMVSNPNSNNGWRLRLQSETGSTDFGINYYSSEATDTTHRPVLTVSYILPIEMTTTVNHCSLGATDGTMSVAVSGGNTYGLSNMYFYKTNRDTSHVGKATLFNAKVTNNLQYNAGTGEVTADNLEPGIYILRILDSEYYVNSDLRFAYYKHILVGREGEITSGILMPNYQYQENTTIEYDKPTNSNPLDRANTNYHNQTTSIPLRISDSPNNYEKASLIKYELDFDDQLEFTTAELKISAWSSFFRHNNSSNATKYSLVTQDWYESDVTWNTRPTIDSSLSITVPTTTYIGYDPVHKIDTVDILTLVEYWQENPANNYGFEMALETYGATQYTSRDYKSNNTNQNYVYFEWSVIMDVETVFNDTTNRGTLTVNAPNGTLPYTYLINNKPLGTLAQAWAEIGDTTFMDSLDFFYGDINSTEYTFTGLPSGKYHIGVYDNSGTKILDGSGIVNTKIQFSSSIKLDLDITNLLTKSQGSQGNGKGRLHAELLDANDWGGLSFTVNTVDEFYVGFNKTSQSVASSVSDFEFGIKVASGGVYQIIENNVLLTSTGSISAGAKIDILKDHSNYIVLIDGSEIYRGAITTLDGEDLSHDLILVGASAELEMVNYWGKFKKPGIAVKVGYPECGEQFGDITILQGVDVTVVSSTLVNNQDATSYSAVLDGGSYVISDIPIGTYTLTTAYSVPPIGGDLGWSYVVDEQVAIGYVVEWENMVNNFVSPLNTIQKGPGPGIPIGLAFANSTNTSFNGLPNWLQFETNVWAGYLEGAGSVERLSLTSQDLENVYGLTTANYFSPSISYLTDGGIFGMALLTSPNGVWRIDQEATAFSLFKENELINDVETADFDQPYIITIQQNGTAQYIKTIASFCRNYPLVDQYIEPKREILGGYFLVPEDDTLRFEFNEEYTIGDHLEYIVRDFTGEEQPGLETELDEVYGDNRFLLDVSALSSGVYIMEIINDKGENWFIRFKV